MDVSGESLLSGVAWAAEGSCKLTISAGQSSKLENLIKPVLDDYFAFVESRLGHTDDNRCVAVSVIMNVDRVLSEAHGVQ